MVELVMLKLIFDRDVVSMLKSTLDNDEDELPGKHEVST